MVSVQQVPSHSASEAPALSQLPEVSVILPTHNRRDLFQRSLRSVLNQSIAMIEVIVIDNACDDGTSEILDAILDPRVKVLRTDSLLNAPAARNWGLENARAAYVAFQDDDDVWLIQKLEKQLAVLQAAGEDCALCLSGYIRCLPRSDLAERFRPYYFDQVDFKQGVLLRNFSVIATPGWLARTTAVRDVGGFDEEMPARNDWELALRLAMEYSMAYVAEPCFLQDQTRATSMMYKEDLAAVALERLDGKYADYWQKHPKTRAAHALYIGRCRLIQKDQLGAGRRWLLTAIKHVPWAWKAWLWLMISWAPLRLRRRIYSARKG